LVTLGMAPLPKSLKNRLNKSRQEKKEGQQKLADEGSAELEENEDPPHGGGSSSSNSD